MRIIKYFSKTELALFTSSILVIFLSFVIFDRGSILSLFASLIGATALIFCAKGNPLGQVLVILFSVLYGIISWQVAYYGEMITYLGMTAPMAILALISWIRNPYKKGSREVKVGRLHSIEWLVLPILTALVTVAFYFILKYFGTANLIFSTVSVTTSFLAVYLTFRRSPYYALAYAANDIVLIILWSLAVSNNRAYVSVLACFVTFLANDFYGFLSWSRMKKRQSAVS